MEEGVHVSCAKGLSHAQVRDQLEVKGQNLPSHVLSLSYPAHWFAPIKLSPFANSIENETIEWMQGLHLVPNEACEKHLRQMEPRHYAGYSHSLAAFDHALMYCKYITMWLLWDDDCVEIAQTYTDNIDYPLRALAGESLPSLARENPYVTAFRHIGDEYQRLGASLIWRKRFAQKMQEWAEHAIREEQVRREVGGDGLNRDFSEALRLRAITVGIRPNSLPLERAAGIELPAEVYNSDEYLQLIDQAALICCLVNDMVGVAKDLNQNQIKSNLVLYYSLYHQTNLFEAYQAILSIHDQAIQRYDRLAEKMLKSVNVNFKECLDTFLLQLRYMDTGFGFWHQDCIRYQRLVAVESGHAFRVQVVSK